MSELRPGVGGLLFAFPSHRCPLPCYISVKLLFLSTEGHSKFHSQQGTLHWYSELKLNYSIKSSLSESQENANAFL